MSAAATIGAIITGIGATECVRCCQTYPGPCVTAQYVPGIQAYPGPCVTAQYVLPGIQEDSILTLVRVQSTIHPINPFFVAVHAWMQRCVLKKGYGTAVSTMPGFLAFESFQPLLCLRCVLKKEYGTALSNAPGYLAFESPCESNPFPLILFCAGRCVLKKEYGTAVSTAPGYLAFVKKCAVDNGGCGQRLCQQGQPNTCIDPKVPPSFPQRLSAPPSPNPEFGFRFKKKDTDYTGPHHPVPPPIPIPLRVSVQGQGLGLHRPPSPQSPSPLSSPHGFRFKDKDLDYTGPEVGGGEGLDSAACVERCQKNDRCVLAESDPRRLKCWLKGANYSEYGSQLKGRINFDRPVKGVEGRRGAGLVLLLVVAAAVLL
ncbi:unnamed protein product [Closterium sp. Naga37s-1]|nr:unnamed protein product [Closterium sp. Naga37s-1]